MNRQILAYLVVIILTFISCSRAPNTNFNLGEFGAFYTKIESDEDFEKYSRTGEYADVVIDLGYDNATLNFWRGSSYLPYYEIGGKKWYVQELVPRSGNGTEIMPDKTNTYSRVSIIENSSENVKVLWRYLPNFSGLNPHKGVKATNFVEEYFTINPDGKVTRVIRKGTDKIDEWNNPKNRIVQTFTLSKNGIINVQTKQAEIIDNTMEAEGNKVVSEYVMKPVAWYKFDEGVGDKTRESVGGTSSIIPGHKTLWKKGVSGRALQFDGYNTSVKTEAQNAPVFNGEITVEAWVAIGAYPWSWSPIIQQTDDVPEEIMMYVDGKLITEDEEYEDDEDEGGNEMEEEEITQVERFQVKYKKEEDKGYFLGISGHGNPGWKLRVGGNWEELVSDTHLERNQWYHIAATYSKESGMMKIYVNGAFAGSKKVAKGDIELSDMDIKIGKGKPRRPTDPVRENTFVGDFAFDGLLDEIRLYDKAMNAEQIAKSYSSYDKILADMDKRALPKGEERGTFGAYYTNLSFYDAWDNLSRFGEFSDVVVEFDDNPSKFIFWRGTSYIPMMVNEKEQWYSNEFNETWSTSGGSGCQEPMSDKESKYNYARILENTPVRAVVHYRFPLVDVEQIKANYVEETGWYDVADWYYYIYPDGVAVKYQHLWTSGERNHEWQESMAIFGPDQHPHDIIDRDLAVTMVKLDGQYKEYSWKNAPPKSVDEPKGSNIQVINYTGDYDPVTISANHESTNVYDGELTPYAAFCTWNHWPVGQMPSDGRYASFADRTSHSSLTHIGYPIYKERKKGPKPFYSKILMEAMLKDEPIDLIPLAKSWLNPPLIKQLHGAKGKYDKSQRAYVLTKTGIDQSPISFSLDASKKSPLNNFCLVIKNWGSKTEALVEINNEVSECKQGFVRDTDGTITKLIWITSNMERPVNLQIIKSPNNE